MRPPPPEPLQRQEQGVAPSSPGTMTPDCPAPEGDARHSQATLRAFPLPKGAGQNEVWMKETLRQRKPHLSSPEGAARLPWATLSYFIVARGCSTVPWATLSYYIAAQGCSTARLSDTSARFRRPKVLGKRRKVESDKKKKKSPKKTRETSVGCPKPGSNRHVFKGQWILSPTRLPIPPFGHIQAVDFPLETSHFRCTSASKDCKVIEFPPIFQNIQQKAYAKKRVIPLVRQKALIPDK